MDEPAKTVEQLMADLRQDVERWKAQLSTLGEQQADIAARIIEWIAQAERVLAR